MIPVIFVLLMFSGHLKIQAQTNCVTPPTGLINWWDGDTFSGTTATDIIGSSDGNLLNGTMVAPGKVGQAFSLDGVDDYISTSLILNYTSGIAYDVWVNPSADKGVIIGDGGGASLQRGMYLGLESGGYLFLVGTRNIDSNSNFSIFGPSISIGSFHHIVASWTGNTTPNGVNLYLDGVLIGSTTAAQSITDGDLPICIGGHSIAYNKFNGLIDEVKIFGRALTSAEVLSIFNAGQAGNCKTDDGGDDNCSCGKNKEKVLVCHKGVEICISKNALQSHLKHGDVCGPCNSKNKLKSGMISNDRLNLEANNEFQLYPNPVADILKVQLPEGITNVNLEIYDLLRRPIKKVISINSTGIGIDMSDIDSGLYFFVVSDKTGLLESGKIMKN